MSVNLAISVLAMMTALPAAPQQDAQAILATMREKQLERWETVDNYAVEQRMEGAQTMSAPIYFEKTTVGELVTFRQVPLNEWMKEGTGNEGMSAEGYEAMAEGYEMMGDAFVEQGNPMSPFVKDMTDDAALMMRMTAEAERSGAAYADEIEDAPNVAAIAQFAQHARLVGKEAVDGREAFHLRADDVSAKMKQPEGNAEFTMHAMSMWIDAAEYVPLRLTMEGELEAEGKRTPLTFEILDQNYDHFGPLYEPQRRVVRLAGLMEAMATDPKRKKELEQMRKDWAKLEAQMAEMEEQLAELPPQARQMVEGQMEKARRQMEMMNEEGILESVLEMKFLGYNEGPPVDWMPFGIETPGSMLKEPGS